MSIPLRSSVVVFDCPIEFRKIEGAVRAVVIRIPQRDVVERRTLGRTLQRLPDVVVEAHRRLQPRLSRPLEFGPPSRRHGVTQLFADFGGAESQRFTGRAIAHLAADPAMQEHSGRALTSRSLADRYGFVDVDGSLPRGPLHERPGSLE